MRRRTSEFRGATQLHRGASPGMMGSAACESRLLREETEMEKLCIFCAHLEKMEMLMGSEATGAYGEEGFSCGKGHFDEFDEGKTDTIEDMRNLFLRATNCADYEKPNA